MFFVFLVVMEVNYIKLVFFIIVLFGLCLVVCEIIVKWVIIEGEVKYIERVFCDFF